MKYMAHCETETQQIARMFALSLKKGDIVALYGDLGVGKTTFCRAVIQSLTHQSHDVPSPTFTLLQTYETDKYPVYHFDFYRLKSPEEAYEIGIEDAFYDGISLIEWPEKLGNLLPAKHIIVEIKMTNNNDREIIIK